MTAHSTLGASSMHRWSACPGSLREIAKAPPAKSSSYAEEGTDAHAYAAWCIHPDTQHRPHKDDLGEQTLDGRQIDVTDEMIEAVAVYYDHIYDTALLGDTLRVEQKFDLSKVYPGCFGTADAVIWKPETKTLHVIDYKHGAGIAVDPTDNPQLQYYGLGALLASKLPAKKIVLTIVQPRCNHPGGPVRSWEIDAIDLLDFRADLVRYADATTKPDAPLATGDHCRFCPAAAMCPALRSQAMEEAQRSFKPVQGYDPEELRKALDSRDVIKAWLKAIDEFAYNEAEQGRCAPGYKLVEKRANRKWRNEPDVIEAMQDMGVKDDVIFEPRSLKSPAQLEKVVNAKLLEPHIVKESSGHVLVPESDKRPAVKVAAVDDFSPVGDDLAKSMPPFLRRAPAGATSVQQEKQ